MIFVKLTRSLRQACKHICIHTYIHVTLVRYVWPFGIIPALVFGTIYRGKLREKFAIPGSWLEDVLTWGCCMPCAIAQEARHVDRAANMPVGGGDVEAQQRLTVNIYHTTYTTYRCICRS